MYVPSLRHAACFVIAVTITCKKKRRKKKLTASFSPRRKFGKQIQKRQLEVPEYAASFVNYKALKKVC